MEGVYLDLYRKLQTDMPFRQELAALSDQIYKAELAGDMDKRKALIMQMIRFCDYNTALLVPYFFPNFDEGKPMSLMGRPYAFGLMSNTPGNTITIAASRQIGKCVTGDTMLTTKIDNEPVSTMSMKEIFDYSSSSSQSTAASSPVSPA